MANDSSITTDRAGNSRMHLRTGDGWARGLSTMLRYVLVAWFGTSSWWHEILIWAGITNVAYLMVGLTGTEEALPGGGALAIFSILLAIGGPIGVSITMQEEVVEEKRSGTAAWVLSKPASRTAFILSKLLGNGAGVLVTMILAQGAIAYLISVTVLGFVPPPLGFLGGMGVHFANLLFYMTLTLMLGALLSHPAPVIGIPIAVLFGQQFVGSAVPALARAIPWSLAVPIGDAVETPLAIALMTGRPVETLLPLIVVLVLSAVFIVVAIRGFAQQEL